MKSLLNLPRSTHAATILSLDNVSIVAVGGDFVAISGDNGKLSVVMSMGMFLT
jgi:hypothetical protein